MIANVENFFMNKILGKLLVSAAASVVGYAASGKLGASITLDPNQVAALFGAAAHMALDFIQHWRQPASAAAAVK